MATDHEYAVIGHSRAQVGRYLGTIAGALAAAAAVLAAAAFRWFAQIGLEDHVPQLVLWPVTAGAVFGIVHWIFNRVVWRWSIVRRLLRIPDLNGCWVVTGTTMNAQPGNPTRWGGELTIRQSWEKIWVHLKTPTSVSRSKAAALLHEPGAGYCLMYAYRNEPGIGQSLSPHVGYAELVFNEALNGADGEYFNSNGRVTYGRMSLIRKVR